MEVDDTSIPFRGKDGPVAAKPGRSHDGKLLMAGAVEIKGNGPGRVRLAVIGDYSGESLGSFVAATIAGGSIVVSDGRARRLPWVHRVFANAKRWGLGVYHGLRRQHLQTYLDGFVFRFHRRHTPAAAFERLLGLAVGLQPTFYEMLISRLKKSSTCHRQRYN